MLSFLKKVEEITFKHSLISGFIFGVISGFIYAPFYYFPLILTFAIFLYENLKATSSKQAVTFGFAFGFGHFATCLFWVKNAYFVFDNPDLQLIGMFVPLFFGFWGSLFTSILAYITYKCNDKYAKWLCFTGFFGILEWVRSWLFTGFPWNPFGSALAFDDNILQIISIIGIYGLSTFLMMFVSSFALLPKKTPLIVSSCIMISFFGFGFLRLKQNPTYYIENGPLIRIVQASIPQIEKNTNKEKALHEYIYLSRKDDEEKKVTHVIWPESAYPFWIEEDDFYRSFLLRAVNQGGTLITGADRKAVDEKGNINLYNSIVAVDDFGEIFLTYDKSHLVPFGEYVPLKDKLPFGIDKIANGFADFSKGDGIKTYEMFKSPPFTPLICFESIFSGKVKNKDYRPSWFLNVSNDAWYGDSAGPYQHLIATKLRATEEGIPVIRASNNGISAVIDAYGRILKKLDLDKKDYIDTPLPMKTLYTTLFGRYGNNVPMTINTIIITLVICFLLHNKKNLL
ncbi:MAG: Apolipoprotein N-acyltransferase [Alphaproteobacteria bacterium ADurb.Bin438]|nr:MAG: Apolipoprotein N-acyltransferase [Alphaproteobacteria bacterium ADurb.Bin438]